MKLAFALAAGTIFGTGAYLLLTATWSVSCSASC